MRLDTSRYPLIVARWAGPMPDEALEAVIAEFEALAARATAERVYFSVVSVGDPEFGAKQRKRLAEWSDRRSARTREYQLDTHIILSSALARGALTALMWLTTRIKMQVHSDEASALAAAQASIARANSKRAG